MPLLQFEPSKRQVEVDPQTSLFEAARRLGLPVGTACEAEGICGRCGLRPLSGAHLLTPETEQERRVKKANQVDPDLRLSCITRVRRGTVVLTADYW